MKFKFLFAAVVIITSAVVIYSCKKVDTQHDTASTVTPLEQKIAMDRALANAARQGIVTTYPVNQKVQPFFSDMNGKKVVRSNRGSKILSNGTSCADYDPLSNDNASLVSVTKAFLCNSGYQFTVTWDISVPNFNAITATNPGNVLQKSIGRMRLKNPGGTVLDQDNAMTGLTITNRGADPLDVTYTIWRFTYTSKFFSQTNVGNSVTAEFNYSMYHTCFPNSSMLISVGYTPALGINTASSNSNPCGRIDKVFINPPMGSGCVQPPFSQSPSITGCNAVGQCSGISGYTFPSTQYVRWRGVNGSGVPLAGAAGAFHYLRLQPFGGPTPYQSIYTFSATAGVDYTRCVRYEFQYVNEYTGCGTYTSTTYPALTTGLVGQEYWQF